MTRSLPQLGASHLSDEAVAAYADGVLAGAPRQRAERHLSECLECAAAVRGQRVATAALRTAASPALPSDLLDRLRRLPATAPLPGSGPAQSVLSPDGRPMFAAFGTSVPVAPAEAGGDGDPTLRVSQPQHPGLPVGMGAMAAAAVLVCVLAGTAAGAGGTAAPAPADERSAGGSAGDRLAGDRLAGIGGPVDVTAPIGVPLGSQPAVLVDPNRP